MPVTNGQEERRDRSERARGPPRHDQCHEGMTAWVPAQVSSPDFLERIFVHCSGICQAYALARGRPHRGSGPMRQQPRNEYRRSRIATMPPSLKDMQNSSPKIRRRPRVLRVALRLATSECALRYLLYAWPSGPTSSVVALNALFSVTCFARCAYGIDVSSSWLDRLVWLCTRA